MKGHDTRYCARIFCSSRWRPQGVGVGADPPGEGKHKMLCTKCASLRAATKKDHKGLWSENIRGRDIKTRIGRF